MLGFDAGKLVIENIPNETKLGDFWGSEIIYEIFRLTGNRSERRRRSMLRWTTDLKIQILR